MMSRIDAKVVLLGKSYAGKTCLVNRYTREAFDQNLPYQNTIGAAFGSKKEIINGKPIMLGIWDTAGHERYESMTRMYYRGAAACILCYDVTDRTSFDRVRFWAGELKATEQNCKIYLVGTKKDIVDDDPSLRDVDVQTAEPLAAELLLIWTCGSGSWMGPPDLQAQFYETSSKTGENIGRLFRQIATDILERVEAEKLRFHKEQGQEGVVHIDTPRGWRSNCFVSKC